MQKRLADIQKAIDSFQMEQARELVAEELQENPSADAYYLASQAAINHGQRVEYLQMALDCDPGFEAARDELEAMQPQYKKKQELEIPESENEPESEAPAPVNLASLGKRWLAIIVDGIVVAIPTLMLVGATGISANFEAALVSGDEALFSSAFSQFQGDLLLLNLLVSAVYNVFFLTYFNGQTLGKIMLGLRVVKKNGRRISWLDAILRNVFGYTISGIFLLGYIWALFDREKQGWHDKLTGTIVIDERQGAEGSNKAGISGG